MPARSPTRYGKYEIVGPLATGGMADLFLARARGPNGFETLAVVKRIRPHLAANPDFVRLFLGEARLVAQLRHPNVVHVYDAGQERGEYFFVMEYVHGRDLRALLDVCHARGRVLSYDEVLSIVAGVCAGLHHAHERNDSDGRPLGIVHRDISPSNVLVSFEGGVKLADFGIAKTTQVPGHEAGTNSLRGKLSYLSPEQCLGLPLDRRADLYALSVVLYELTTGARPHGEAPSEFLALKQTLEAPVRRPSTLRPDYPPELERIVLRGLDRDREQRHASARELQLELEAFARRAQLALSPLTLTRLMEELFANELAAWQAAQQSGKMLLQHLAETGTVSIDEGAERATAVWAGAGAPATLLPSEPSESSQTIDPGRRRGRRLVAASVVLAALVSALIVGVARQASQPAGADAPPPRTPVAAPSRSDELAPPPPPPVVVTAPAREPSAPPKAPPPSPAKVSRAHVRNHPIKRVPPPRRPSRWDPEAPVLPH